MRYVLLVVATLTFSLMLSGCGHFWDDPEDGSGDGSGSGVYGKVFVANASSNGPSVAAFSISQGDLRQVGSYALNEPPSAITLNPHNSLLFVSGVLNGIYCYSVYDDGTLSVLNGGTPVATGVKAAAMQVDPTGHWLIVADSSLSISIYSIDAGNGNLSLQGHALQLDSGSVQNLLITPNGKFVFVSLGTGGVDILSLNTDAGILTKQNLILHPKQTNNAAYGLASDPNSIYLYVTESGMNVVRVLTIGSDGSLSELPSSPYAAGAGPYQIITTGSFVYVANKFDGTISGYSAGSNGALAALSGSPYLTGQQPAGVVEDESHTYLFAICSGGNPDLQMFSTGFDVPGKLTPFANASTGADPANPIAIAGTK